MEPSTRQSFSPSPVPVDVSRSACETCRKRKIKCTGERPHCARCQRMSKTCEYLPTLSAASHVSSLAARVRELEAQLSLAPSDETNALGADASSVARNSLGFKRTRSQLEGSEPYFSMSPRTPQEDAAQPNHVLSSLPSNAQLVQHMPAAYELPWITGEPFIPAVSDAADASFDRSVLPASHILDQLLDHFFMYTNSAYPIVHEPTFRAQTAKVCDRGHSSPSDVCLVFLVLAVACTSLRRSSSLFANKWRADILYGQAAKLLPRGLEAMGLTRLQLLLMQLQYTMFNPQVGRVWDLSGSAIRAAVDLALHHQPPGQLYTSPEDTLQNDMRRRLFWSAYCIDRNLCIALGRPPAIADDWITAELPLECDDSLITNHGLRAGPPASPAKTSAIHHFRIRRLQSEIHHRLLSATPTSPSQEWYESVRTKLQEWRDCKPPNDGFCSALWAEVNYQSTMVLLHRPSPANPSPGVEDLRRALTAAGRVMRGYKEMHRAGRINFDWLAMYTLFMAGITYLNSLWQAQKSGWTIVDSYVDALMDIHICTGLMEALAAVTPGTAGIRDAFESVSERIIRHLTIRAHGTSRPATPPILSEADLFDIFPHAPRTTVPDPFEGFETSALDPFLLHPLGQFSIEDWERAMQSDHAL